MGTISLTIPLELNALTRASEMLHGLAIDLSKKPVVTGPGPSSTAADDQHIAAPAPAPAPAPAVTTDLAATEVFGGPKQQAPAPAPANSAAETATPQAGGPTQNTPAQTETATPAPAGVEVDNDGLPWDHRIHALGAGGTHNKLKKTQQWKKKRGVDAALVTEVEAELLAAMSAGPANPVVTTTEPAPAPAPAPTATGAVTTFPSLMSAITANGIDLAAVTAAVNAQGLTHIPLLASRPDLIPAVAAALGV